MKHSKIVPIIVSLMLVASTVPAYALDVGLNGNLNVNTVYSVKNDNDNDSDNDNDKNDDKSSQVSVKALANADLSSRIKAWAISAGTIGQVTAVAAGSLTMKTSSGEIFVVSTADATVRRGGDSNSTTAIVVGDTIYVFGVKNGSTIAASMIIVGKSKSEVQPNDQEKRKAYFGVITAKTDTSLTILGANNTVYTVTVVNAQIWINKTKQSSLSGLVVGDNVMVQGDLSGSTIAAKNVVAIHLPLGTIVGKITAISGTTLTVLGSDNKVYTVIALNAEIKAKGNKDKDEEKNSKLSNLAVGDSVLVKGDLSGTTITAKSVTEEKIKEGFFHRFGLFFKGIFGKK